ncbi:MAG TPA: LysE family transporter [Kofleriaceae bacterium]|nr:LysE family transporter [Kofleriaceae bacterium]
MPLGVINVAIVDAAAAGHRRFATGLGIGGALADSIHASLAFIGTGQLVTRRPELVRGLAIGAAILILGYALFAWRRERTRTTVDHTHTRAALTGFVLTLPNPGALTAWVAVAASVWPTATVAEAITIGAGVGIGSAVWFAVLAWLVGKIPPEHRVLKLVPKLALLVLLAIAIVGLVRLV